MTNHIESQSNNGCLPGQRRTKTSETLVGKYELNSPCELEDLMELYGVLSLEDHPRTCK